MSLLPLRLPLQASALLWACLLGAMPVLAFQSLDLVRIGGESPDPISGVLDRLAGTPWLLALLPLGLAFPASRFLAGSAATAVAFNLAWHFTGHGVPGWYNVLSTVLVLVSVALVVDAWLKRCLDKQSGGSPRSAAAAALVPLGLAFLVVGSATLTPPGPDRIWLQPFAGDGGDSLSTLKRFETTIRERDYVAATAHADATTQTVVAVDIYPPRLLVPFEAQAGHIVLVWTPLHEGVAFGFAEVAAAIEAPDTLTVLEVRATRLNEALRATYADCRVEASTAYEAFEAAGCAGRAQALESAWRQAATVAA